MLSRRSCALHLKILTFVFCLIYLLLSNFNNNEYSVIIINNTEHAKGNTQVWNFVSDLNNNLCRPNATSTPIFQLGMSPKVENLFDNVMDPLKFHKDLRNPCFYQTQQFNIYEKAIFEQRKLRCLPYFYIIGFPKCATTDLWDRLLLHPQIVARHEKESFYIDDKRFNKQWSFGKYLDYFSETTREIFEQCKGNLAKGEACNIVTGEATANTAAVNDMWYLLPENRGCSEPRFTNPDYLYSINPNMKLIALVRDPVKRLWSDYLYLAQYFNYKTSPEEFHQHAINAMGMYKDCLKYFTSRGCANNVSIGSIQMRLRMGLYDVHIADWLRVFPRKQLMVIRTEDYKKKMSRILLDIFEHLDLDMPAETVHQEMIKASEKNVHRKDFDMFTETKHLLYKFYKPSYEKLSSILHDPQYVLKEPDG